MDTNLIIDTLSIKNISGSKNIFTYIFYDYKEVIIFISGFIFKYFYDLFVNYRNTIKVKRFLLFSLKLLEKSVLKQIQYIKEFKVQFENENTFKNVIELDPSFQINNISNIPVQELFKILVLKINLPKNEREKFYSNFNFAKAVIERTHANIEKDMNDYSKEEERYIFKINEYIHDIQKKLNEYIEIKTFVSTPNNIKDFTNKAIELFDNYGSKYKQPDDEVSKKGESTIFNRMNEVYFPLLEVAKKERILTVVNILPEMLTFYNQYKFVRKKYLNTYNSYIKQLELAHSEIKNTIDNLK